MQINAIEISNNEEWHNLWLETHYKQVQLAFKSEYVGSLAAKKSFGSTVLF